MMNNYEKMEQVELALQNLTQNLEGQVLVQTEESPAIQEMIAVSGDEVQEEPVKPAEEEQTEEAEIQIQETTAQVKQMYIVKKGDTLLGICHRFYGDDSYMQEICELNQIENEDHIMAGEKILLP